jgi:hypothetical protein
VVLVVAIGVGLAPLGRPLLPVEAYVRYAAALGLKPGAGERHELGRLPQHFADMHGWREMAETVAGVVRALPASDRAKACVFGQNYGEAGAIEYFGRELGLPPVLSGHNSYWLWGPGSCTGEVLVVVGDGREALESVFSEVTLAAVSRCRDCMPYENDLPVWVVRRPRLPLAEVWPRVKRFV